LSDVYLFGYQSILAEGSLSSTVGAAVRDYVPARLRDHARDWKAVRDFSGHPSKRYVHVADWRPADRVAFATLCPTPGQQVNGLCHRVPADRLGDLDFREQGYRRIEVSGQLTPYPGHVLLPGLPCYTYLDAAPDATPAPVSRAYYDMGRLGAKSIDRGVPGFAADYQATTRLPARLADDLAFLFISADGRHLWLLDERDSSLVLLLRFSRPQFPPVGDGAAELARPVSADLAWLDLRDRQTPIEPHPRVPVLLADALAASPVEQAASPYWLARLTACEALHLKQPVPPGEREKSQTGRGNSTGSPTPAPVDRELMVHLAADPDPWVRRAARLRLGESE
jgi:hypothetical protein